MTIPYLTNCSHTGDGWCLDCVKAQGETEYRLRAALEEIRDNARHLLAGGLSHFSRRDFALAVQMITDHVLRSTRPTEEDHREMLS